MLLIIYYRTGLYTSTEKLLEGVYISYGIHGLDFQGRTIYPYELKRHHDAVPLVVKFFN